MRKSYVGLIAGVFAAVSLCLAAGAVLFAEQSSTPPAPKYTQVKYSADDSSYRWIGENRILVLKGNVKFVHGDTTMVADRVEYDESSRTATGTGNLKIFNMESNVTGDKCVLSFKEKKASIVGNVVLVSKPKPDAAKKGKGSFQTRDEVTVTCASLDYFYKEKKAVIPTPLVIVQKDRRITADSGTYYEDDDKVILTGNVKGEDEKAKHSFTSPKVTISLKDNDQWMQAEKASGTFYVKDEEEEKKPAKPAEKPAEPAKDKPAK
jgi:lipopolysaccharide assembly outer membrane protein LptD (OstA)